MGSTGTRTNWMRSSAPPEPGRKVLEVLNLILSCSDGMIDNVVQFPLPASPPQPLLRVPSPPMSWWFTSRVLFTQQSCRRTRRRQPHESAGPRITWQRSSSTSGRSWVHGCLPGNKGRCDPADFRRVLEPLYQLLYVGRNTLTWCSLCVRGHRQLFMQPSDPSHPKRAYIVVAPRDGSRPQCISAPTSRNSDSKQAKN